MNMQNPITKPKRRGFIYTRLSTQEQAENKTSLAQQERDCRQHCEKNGITVAGVFKETAR
jgi:DNA invertase Pin-like site-specific DNA recombinase